MLRKKLERYADGCSICVTKGEGGRVGHEWWECEVANEVEVRRMEQAWDELSSIE